MTSKMSGFEQKKFEETFSSSRFECDDRTSIGADVNEENGVQNCLCVEAELWCAGV